ncbi:hypothetical protein D3C85_790430 [compost metagenome]
MAHAFFSPSGAPAALLCNAKIWREKDIPDMPNEASDEGTAAHFLLEQCLEKQVEAAHFIGTRIQVKDGKTEFHTSGQWPVGRDMVHEIQKTLDVIHSLAEGATIYPEQTLSIEFITGEPGATGTSDTVIIKGKTAVIADLKYGRGVQVFAEGNEQLLIYGASAVADFDALGEIEEVELHILQPRLNHFDVWKLSVAEMNERIEVIRQTAKKILAGPEGLTAVPGAKQCKFCKVPPDQCQERTDYTLEVICSDFVDLDKGFVKVEMPQAEKLLAQSFGVKPAAVTLHESYQGSEYATHFTVKKPNIRPSLEAAEAKLPDASDERLATLMDAADMIEGFAKAVRAEVERRLLAGKFTDARYKLVEGRQGARSWTSEEEAEAALKAMRLKVDQMYDFKLISPTTAEKVLKEANPRKWNKLQPLIGRSDGKPSVAPASDKRPALSMAIAEQFEELPAEVEQPVAEDNFDDLV